MTEKRYISMYHEVFDTHFGYMGTKEPTEREIEEQDYLVICECKSRDYADELCKLLNEKEDEINCLKQEKGRLKVSLSYIQDKYSDLVKLLIMRI